MNRIRCVLLALAVLASSVAVQAQKKGKSKKSSEVAKTDTAKAKTPTIKEKTTTARKIPGLFILYQDTVSGSLQLYIAKKQLQKDFIYQSFSMGGPPELFLNQNMIRETWLFTIQKNFD